MIREWLLSFLLPALLFCHTDLHAQWSEHRTPVGKHISSLAFVGDQVFAQSNFPNSTSFETVTAENGGVWANLAVPADTLCPGGLCKSKTIESENGHLYYVNSNGWPGFAYKSDDAGQSWDLVIPHYSDFLEVLFSGDYIFASANNVVWRSNSDGLESHNSFISQASWNISDICQWDDKLLLLDGIGLWVSANSGDTWTPLTNAITAVGLSYTDADLFAFGNSLFLSAREQGMHTSTDGGATWNLLPFPGGRYVHSMIEYNGKLFCGDGKNLFTSADGGLTWVKELAAPGPNVLKVNSNEIWMGTDYGIFKSTDSGKNWVALNPGLHRPLFGSPYSTTTNKTLFSHAGRMFLSTEFGLFDTPDDGETWRYAGNFENVTTGIAGDSALVINEGMQLGNSWYYSRDTGQTWQLFPLPPNVAGTYNLMLYASGAYYFFANATCYKTSNFGQDWEQLPITFPGAIWQAAFSQGKLFAVAHNGYAISEDLGMTWNIEPLAGISDFQLFFNEQQIYARFTSIYYRYDTDHWQQITVSPSGNYTLVVGEQALFAYDVTSTFAHNLLLSVDEGENWINLISAQPFLTNRNFDRGALAFGMHNNSFYAFGKSATDGVTPALWKLNTGETGNPIRPGKVFFDQNSNGIPDGTDRGIPNIVVSTPSAQAISNVRGEFVFFSGAPGDTLRPYLNNPSWISEPAFHILSATPQPYFFAITVLPGVPDLVVSATAAAAFRPGSTTALKIRVINTGSVNATGMLRFIKPTAIEATPDSPPANAVSADTLIWNLDLLPFINYDFNVLLEIPTTVSIGTLLPFFVEAIPDIPDAFLADNTVSFTETVVGSFDPNDKLVDPERISTEVAAEGTWLDYTIRFQNTGTDYAGLVRLTDTLSERLDLPSIQIRSASHACQYAFREGRVLEATFYPIALSPTLANEPGSHGFLRFAIRLLPGLEETDTVRNAAHIVFDYNAPVRTNTAKTWVEVVSAIRELTGSWRQLTLFPNPASAVCTIATPQEMDVKNAQLYVMDPTGRLLQTHPFTTELKVGNLATGIYFVVLKTLKGEIAMGKLIKQ